MEQHDWHCQTYAAWLFEMWNEPKYWDGNGNEPEYRDDNNEEGILDDQIDY